MSDADQPNTHSELATLRSTLNHFADRRKRAAARLAQNPHREWSFALVGITTNVSQFSEDNLAHFRPVIEPPGEVELARTLRDSSLFGAIGRYSHLISHELTISMQPPPPTENGEAFSVGWWLISALRVKTRAEFLVPVAANYSWSVIAALADRQCEARLLEDVPQAPRLDEAITVCQADLDWAVSKVVTFAKMIEEPRFRLAVEALTTHPHLLNRRMMAAALWSGIESLIGARAELRYRIALCAAALLENRGPQRFERYTVIKKLYDVRSKAVHGSSISDSDLLRHIIETRKLLSDLIVHMVERGTVLSEAAIERNVLE
jgi:hypothetical protein